MIMKKRLYVISLVMGGAICVQAQEAPIFEFGGQYQMLRVNSSSAIPAFTANGLSGSFQVDFLNQLAGVLEVGVQHNGNIHDIHLSNNWLTYLVGPRVSLRNRGKKVVPSLEALVGGATVFGSGTTPGGVHLAANTTGFATALGGTLDIRLTHRIALRPIQLDYLLTRINNSTNQHNLRYGAGLIFTFGEQ
jgi:peptidoglycan-associated lipoprotein